jgi:predicted nucleic acid-binding protein
VTFVLDASVALMWLLPESNPAGQAYATAVLSALSEADAVAPALWALEIANVVAKVEAKGILNEAETQRYLTLLGRLNIGTDHVTATHAWGATLHLARRYRLSAYDAAYLELALRNGLPLASLDAALIKAAEAAGVHRFTAQGA